MTKKKDQTNGVSVGWITFATLIICMIVYCYALFLINSSIRISGV